MKTIPTIKEIANNITSDIVSRLNLSIDYLKKTYAALAGVLAVQLHLAYLYLKDVQDNVFPDKATLAEFGGTLERQGQIYLNRNPFPDSIGSFYLSVKGISGSILRANITFKSNETALNQGALYVLDSEYTLTGSDDVILVRSLGAGVSYNLLVGDELTITEPVIGVDKTVTVSSILVQPTAGETTELYRQAILTAIQLEPQGGSRGDYRQWATDAQGVRLVYPYVRDSSPGFIDIYVESTIVDSLDGKGTPSQAILDEVESVIEFDPDVTKEDYARGRKPIQSFLNVVPVVLVPVDVSVNGLSDSSDSVKNAIDSSINDFIYGVRPFIAGADLIRNKNNVLYSGKVQSVVTDVLSSGNFFTTLDLSVNGNMVTSFEFTLGNIPYLRTLNFN